LARLLKSRRGRFILHLVSSVDLSSRLARNMIRTSEPKRRRSLRQTFLIYFVVNSSFIHHTAHSLNAISVEFQYVTI